MAETVEQSAPDLTPEQRMVNLLGGATEPAEQQAAESPADEVAQPAADDTSEVSTEAPDQAAEEQPAEDTEPLEELVHLDKTYEVPASLKKAFEENRAMATRSAQAAKQAEALFAHINAQAQVVEAESKFKEWAATEIGEKDRLEAILSQYKKLDWYGMSPEQYQEHRRNRDIVAEQLDDAKKAVDGKKSQFDSWKKQRVDEVIAKGQEYLTKVIPNFAAEDTRINIAKQAVSLGFTKEELASNSDPRFIVALHKAAQWDRAQANKSVVANKVSKAAPAVKAGSSNASNNSAVAKEKALRARLKQTGSLNDAAALLLQRTR